MPARFHQAPFFENKNLVCMLHSRKAMRDNEGRAADAEFRNSFLNRVFGGGIDAGGRVIQNEKTRIEKKCAGNCDSLFLAAAQCDSAFSDDRIVTFLECRDEAVGLRRASAPFDIFVTRAWTTVRDIVSNRRAKQKCG